MLKIDQPEKVKKVYKIPKFSKKRASQNREYDKARKEFLFDNPICQARQIPGCDYYASDVHHKSGRIGDKLTDKSGFLAVCRYCHQKIELNPEWAKKRGFSTNRNK